MAGGYFDLDIDFTSPLQNTEEHSLADIEKFIRS